VVAAGRPKPQLLVRRAPRRECASCSRRSRGATRGTEEVATHDMKPGQPGLRNTWRTRSGEPEEGVRAGALRGVEPADNDLGTASHSLAHSYAVLEGHHYDP
jgi:hypothetical protein